MAVIGSARPIESKISVDEEFNRSYTSTYEVITNDKTDGPALVLTAPGLPAFGSQYQWYNTFDEFAYCVGGTASIRELKKTALVWTVQIKHESPKSSNKTRGARQPSTGSPDPITERKSPTDEPWEISGSFAQFLRPVIYDSEFKPIVNTVWEPYVPAIEMDDSRKILVLRKNTPTISLAQWADYSDKVNGTVMWGLWPRQIKLNQWNWTMKFYGPGIAYVENQWEFHISFEMSPAGEMLGWTHVILNEGFRQLVDPTAADPAKRFKRITIRDQPITKPVPLDPFGVPIDITKNPAYFNYFKVYVEREFRDIGIPDPLPGGVFI